MVALRRDSDDPYQSSTFLTPLEEVSRIERLLPLEWIAPEGNDVREEFIRYAAPLIPALKHYPRLEPRA
jgi:6-phosphofructokinase 1